MKKILLAIGLFIMAIQPSNAAKSYEMEVMNLVQLNESAFTFDVRMRNTNIAEPFAIEAIQWQFSFNTALMNGGSLQNIYLTYIDGTTDLVGIDIIPLSSYFSTNQTYIRWLTAILGDGGETTFFGDGNWKRIGTFKIELRNADNTAFHNFADVAHNLAFVPSEVIVNWCNYFISEGLYYRTGPFFEIIPTKTLTNSLSNRPLAGYWFSGTGNWSSVANWNNVTLSNFHTLPGSSNNAIIDGFATASSTYTVNELTVAEGAYLVLDKDAKVTTTIKLYNDNALGGGSTAVTVAGWNFENTNKTTLPYTADNGVVQNKDIASINITGNCRLDGFYFAGDPDGYWTTGSRAPAVDRFYRSSVYGSWIIEISTLSYSDLKLSSSQFSGSGGPITFKIQWSLNGTIWNDVSGGAIVLNEESWTSISDLTLPADLNNQASVFIQWKYHTGFSQAVSAIDDILITGVPLPTGILLESTASGTGSLIQNTDGVQATVQRYIQGTDNYHYISSPVSTSGMIFDDIFPNSLWNNKQLWVREFDEPSSSWINKLYYQTPVVGKGYSTFIPSSYTPPDPPLAIYEGAMGNGDVPITLSFTSSGWNLVGNPYPSAIDWDLVSSKTNIDGAVYVWGSTYQGVELGNYITWNGSTGSLSDGTIPVGQGFFVHASAAGAGFTFANNSRVHSNTSFWKSGNDLPELLTIEVTNSVNVKRDKVFINFNPEATSGFDNQFDAYKLQGDEDAPEIYTKGEENLSINVLNSIQQTPLVQLGFKAGVAGIYTFNCGGTGSFSDNTPIFLEDLTLGIMTDLRTNPAYSFTSGSGIFNERFRLKFGSLGVGEDHEILNAYSTGNVIHVMVPQGVEGIINIYDVFGQLMLSLNADRSGKIDIPVHFAEGIYIVQLTTPKSTLTRKVLTR